MNQFGDLRALNVDIEKATKDLLDSWGDQKLFGFNWSLQKLLHEIKVSSDYALLQNGKLMVLVTFKEIFPEAEINFVLKARGVDSSLAIKTLIQLIDNKRQTQKWWLEVHEKNQAAQSLYLKVGFSQVSVRKNYYPDGGSALIYSVNRDKLFKS